MIGIIVHLHYYAMLIAFVIKKRSKGKQRLLPVKNIYNIYYNIFCYRTFLACCLNITFI